MNNNSNQNEVQEEAESATVDIKSRIAAFQSNSNSNSNSNPNFSSNSNFNPTQYATYQSNRSPIVIKPATSQARGTNLIINPQPKIGSPIQRHNSLPRERESNHSPSSASNSNSRNSDSSNAFTSEFGIIKSEAKASTFGGKSSNPNHSLFNQSWNNGSGSGNVSASFPNSPFHLETQEDRQSKLRKSASGLSLRELAAQSDADRRGRSNSTESGHLASPNRRGSPVGPGSGASSPRLGVKNIIALYGGNSGSSNSSAGGVLPGSLGRSASPSSSSSNGSFANRNSSSRLGVSIPDASSSTDSFHQTKRLPRHMLDASEDGSTSLELHPTLCPSPSTQSPIISRASSPAGDLFTSTTNNSSSIQQSVKPPAPPRPPKPSTSNTAPVNTPPRLPSRFTVQPPTPSRHSTTSTERRSSHSPNRSGSSGPYFAPLLPPRKGGTGSSSAGVSPSSTGDGSSVNYPAYTPRRDHPQSGPALPPRGYASNNTSPKEISAQRRSSADNGPASKPPPLPRRSMGTSNSAASDLSISSSNGSSTSINIIPPPRHRPPAQTQHHHQKTQSSNFSSVSLTDDASAELKHSLESEIGDRSALTGRNDAASSSTPSSVARAPLSPSNPLLPPPRAVRSLAQGAPSRIGAGLGSIGGNASGFRFGSGTNSTQSSPNRGRTLIKKPNKAPKRSYSPDPSSRSRYEDLFERMLVAESIKKQKKKDKGKEKEIKNGISIPSRRDLNKTIISNDDVGREFEVEVKGIEGLKSRFEDNNSKIPTRSSRNGLATSAPSERENSNPFPTNSNHSQESFNQSHRYTNSAGPGLETFSSNPYIPIKRIEKLFKSSKLSNDFLFEIFNHIIKFQNSNQIKGLEKEPFIKGLTAIDYELMRKKSIRDRKKSKGLNGNGLKKLDYKNGISRNNTIKANQRSTSSDFKSSNSLSNWSEATRLPKPKRVVPPPKPIM